MNFGYFDDKQKEYVITNPNTPKSWSNYLGSKDYGAIITNNAGGYSFYRSAAQGRFMRMRFNSIPMDQPGRYIYIHDRESKDSWSTSWQPVAKDLNEYESTCRHGTAYTIIDSKYSNIQSVSTYFVPIDTNHECWLIKIINSDSKKRKLRLFTFVEYANNWHINQDFMNLQYTQYILRMSVHDNIIDHGINVLLPDDEGDIQNHDGNRHTFMGIYGAEVSGYDTDRDIFLGNYRSYHNPIAVEKGECKNSLAYGDNGCGVLQIDIELEPNEIKEFCVIMGIGKASVEGKSAIGRYASINDLYIELEKLKKYWHPRLESMSVQTPDAEFNSMTNVWSPYNSLITYSWSRAASLVYSGERDGLGYRDTVQDFLGVMHTIPEEVVERLELMITGQTSSGGAMPVVKPFAHSPGSEILPSESEYRSDDTLWLFNSIPAYVKETGEIDFFRKVLPYSDKGEDTVLGHLKQAIKFSLERKGKNNLPCGLSADWNDCLQLGHEGESVFVAFQLRYALKLYSEITNMLKEIDEAEWATNELARLDEAIENYAWDGNWYIRAITDDGLRIGSKVNEEGKIWLNVQTWAILSGHATGERAKMVAKAVQRYLASEYGVTICAPPYVKINPRIVKAPLFNEGMKENASIFSHTQGWAVIAESMLGNGNNAYNYYRSVMPAAYNNKAEIRQIEPYVNCQFTHSKFSPRFGASRLPWLTGAATWMYYSATHYILGIQPDYYGLRIDPCIPAGWESFSVKRKFRNNVFDIEIENSEGVQKGVKRIILNNKEIEGNLIPLKEVNKINSVRVIMGDI